LVIRISFCPRADPGFFLQAIREVSLPLVRQNGRLHDPDARDQTTILDLNAKAIHE